MGPETILSILCGVLSAALTTAIGWGVMKEKIRRIEADIAFIHEDRKTYVTHEHFEAVVQPIKSTLDVVQKDVKEILRVVRQP